MSKLISEMDATELDIFINEIRKGKCLRRIKE